MNEFPCLYILNGPNLNLLGKREPAIYGTTSYDELCAKLEAYAKAHGVRTVLYQSNHEGDLIDKIQEADRVGACGVILNAGGYTHTSVSLGDAIRAVSLPTVEVHISNPDAREEFRRVNFIRSACAATIKGHGIDGYFEAVDLLLSLKR